MAGVNKVILLGNLGADPEVKHLESGSTVAKIRLATTESYKDKEGNRKDMTEWHDVEMWDGLARIAEQYLKKGDSIYLEGRIKSDVWQDEQGNNRKAIRIRATSMTMLPKGDRSGAGQNYQQPAPQTGAVGEPKPTSDPLAGYVSNDAPEDLPF